MTLDFNAKVAAIAEPTLNLMRLVSKVRLPEHILKVPVRNEQQLIEAVYEFHRSGK